MYHKSLSQSPRLDIYIISSMSPFQKERTKQNNLGTHFSPLLTTSAVFRQRRAAKCAIGAILITFGLHPRFTQRLEVCELEGFHRASSLWKDLEDASDRKDVHSGIECCRRGGRSGVGDRDQQNRLSADLQK